MSTPNPKEMELLKTVVHDPTHDTSLPPEERVSPDRQAALKVQSVAEAVSEGKLPTTSQTVAAIERMEENRVLGDLSRDLSSSGRKVIADTEIALDTLKEILKEKNSEDELQTMVYFYQKAKQEISDTAADSSLPQETRDHLMIIRKDLNDMVDRVINVTQLIVTSPEFRSVVNDLINFFRDTLRQYPEIRTLEEAATELQYQPQPSRETKALPEHEQAEEHEEHAVSEEEEEYVDVGGGAKKKSKKKSKKKQQQHPTETPPATPKQSSTTTTSETSAKAESYAEAAKDTAEQVKGIAQEPGTSAGEKAKKQVETVGSSVDRTIRPETQQKLAGAAQSIAERTSGYVRQVRATTSSATEATKKVSQDVYEAAKEKFTNIQLSDEDKARMSQRFKEILVAAQKTPDYQKGISDLIGINRDVYNRTYKVMHDLQEQGTAVYERIQYEARQFQSAAQKLVENFAGKKSLNPLITGFQQIASEVRDDQDLMRYMDELSSFVNKSLIDTSFIQREEFDDEFSRKLQTGRSLLMDKHGENLRRLGDLANEYVDALRKDDLTNEFATELQALMRDLTLDEQGRPTLKVDLVRDLIKLVPRIAEKMAYLPVPRIEYEDEDYHYIFDNIVLKCTNILPKFVSLRTDTVIDADRPEKDQVKQLVQVQMSRIQASARDIVFFYDKKSGLLQPADVGLADFDIPGPVGITIWMLLEPILDAKPGEHVMKIRRVETEINEFQLNLRRTHHDFMYKILGPYIKTRARQSLEDVISSAVQSVLERLDERIAIATASAAEMMGMERKGKGKMLEGERLPEWSSHAYDVKEE